MTRFRGMPQRHSPAYTPMTLPHAVANGVKRYPAIGMRQDGRAAASAGPAEG